MNTLPSTSFFQKTKTFIFAHKIISGIIVVVILYGGYKIFGPKTAVGQTLYTLGTVQQGTIISSVSESGQVAATDQVSVQAQASGLITWVGVKPGQTVHAGQALASIDSTNAKQAISDAEASLNQAKLQFQQDQIQAPFSYQTSINNLTTDQTNLTAEYVNTFNTLSTTYLDLPNVVTGMNGILYGFDLSPSKTQANVDFMINYFNNDQRVTAQSFGTSAENDYTTAMAVYNPAILAYQQLNRTSSTSTTEAALDQAITTTTAVAQSLQSELNFIGQILNLATQYNVHISTTITTLQTSARGYLTTTNSDLNSLLAEKKALQSAKNTINNDQQSITLLQVGNDSEGNNPISLQISQSNIAKQEVDLANQKALLANYTVVAPFDGTISTVNAVVGASAGAVATIITNKQIANLSLNEVDVSKIALGDKVTMNFDAITGLTISGTVAEIDSVGTVSQGVVSYNVQIAFDTQNPAVRPGMTVNAVIQTAVHTDALYVPSTAIKTTNGASYVQVFTPPLTDATGSSVPSATAPSQVPVTIGISDDTNVEILSGLTVGQQIVARTAISSATTKPTTTTSAASLLGGTRGATGGFGGGAGAGRTTTPVTRGG
jgi:multidrug efflux pump subunit AcrA (membrane-fusion protein)